MTQEEKAKAYDEAIKKAESLYKASEPMSGCNVIIETLFPELKESEDEKVRKALLELVHDTTGDELWIDYNVHKEEALDWLERQVEQNFEMKTAAESLGIDSDTYNKIVDECIFGEQKPEDKIEDEEYNGEDYGIDSLYHAQRILEKTLGKVDGYQTDDGILSHKCAITAVKKLYEQKPTWSKEDEEMLQGIWDEILANKHDAKECEWKTYDKFLDWLKSLRPQNTYNPYKAVVESITEMCKHYDKTTDLQDFYDNVKVKCKDAKEYDSLFPQNRWRTSELQLGCLSDAIEYYNSSGYPAPKLKELYEQLKKL